MHEVFSDSRAVSARPSTDILKPFLVPQMVASSEQTFELRVGDNRFDEVLYGGCQSISCCIASRDSIKTALEIMLMTHR